MAPSRMRGALRGLIVGLILGLAGGAGAQDRGINVGMALEPPGLDPTAGAAAAIDEVVYANVFEGLTRIGPDGAVEPALAESWEISEDGLTYTFKLHEGVTFHDGTTFDAEDAAFSLDRARAEDSVNAQKRLFTPIESVEAVDPHTLKVTLKQPVGNFLWNLGWGDAVMVAPESAATNAESPIGTGPFAFSRWRRGDRVELARNPDYWGEAPALSGVTFKFISDPTAAMAALLAGDLDAFPNVPAPESVAQFQNDPRFTVEVGTTEGETILAMNSARPPFDTMEVRRALSHAIDRKSIVDGAMFGFGTPIGSHFAPHHPAYVDLTGMYPYDPEKARQMLREAGVAEGTSVTLKLPPPTYARRGGEIVAAQLRDVGLDVEIIPLEWAQWLEEVFRGKDYDLTIVSHTEPLDIDIYARDDYYFHVEDPTFDEIMAKLGAEADPEKRLELLEEAQRRIAENAVNVFLFQLAKIGVWNADLEGLWSNAPVQANDMTKVRWKS